MVNAHKNDGVYVLMNIRKKTQSQEDGLGKFLQKLIDKRSDLPKKQRQLSDYMIEHYQTIGVLTLSKLAKQANVSTTTAMRLIRNLGYENYSEVKSEILHATVQAKPFTSQHGQASFKNSNVQQHILFDANQEINTRLDHALNPSLIDNFNAAIQIILQSSQLHILGVRSNKALAYYFSYLLEEFYPHVVQLSHDAQYIYDRIVRFKKNDTLLLIDNSPFTTIGIEGAKYCYEQGHPVILITDDPGSPAMDYASIVLNTAANNKQYSVVPTVFVMEALIIEIGRKTSHTSIQVLEKLGSLLEEKNITQPFSFNDSWSE